MKPRGKIKRFLSSGTVEWYVRLTSYYNVRDGLILLFINFAGVLPAVLQNGRLDHQSAISLHILADFIKFTILFIEK